MRKYFKVLDGFVTSNGLWWSRCVGICTDGAKTMKGRHSGMVRHMQAVAPDATCVHCSIHREALAAKGMPDGLKDVLDTTVVAKSLGNDTNMNFHKVCCFSVFRYLCQMLLWNTDV